MIETGHVWAVAWYASLYLSLVISIQPFLLSRILSVAFFVCTLYSEL